MTDANWIAAVKTGGVKNPFNALNTLLTGWVNRTTQKPTITSANTIFDALKALYWASGNGNVLNISNGENRFGFVGWNANTAYGFMVDTANFTIYIRQWAQAQATSNANTTALWREAIQGGEIFSLKEAIAKPIHVVDFTTINELWPIGQYPGATALFYATGEMYSAPPGNDTGYVGQITLNADFAQSGMATVIAYGNKTGRLYHAQLNFAGQGIDWSPSPSGTISVSDFKAVVGSAVFQNMRDGEVVGFFSSSGGGASGPGVNPVLGYIQRASASQANILAYNMGATKAWIGYATSAATKWTELGGGGNVIHGEDITEGLEYLIPENVGDVVAFRSTMDSSQVPAEQEGFGFLAKVNGSESMAMMMQNDPAGGGKMKFFMGRVQNDGTGTDWQELTTGSSSGTEQLFVGDIALANAAPETFNLGGEVHDGDLLMIVYDFISSDHTMVGPKGGRSIIWTATSGTYDVTVEAFDYSSATGGVSRISGFSLMLSASGTILSMEATGEIDTIIEAFHVVGIYKLLKAL